VYRHVHGCRRRLRFRQRCDRRDQRHRGDPRPAGPCHDRLPFGQGRCAPGRRSDLQDRGGSQSRDQDRAHPPDEHQRCPDRGTVQIHGDDHPGRYHRRGAQARARPRKHGWVPLQTQEDGDPVDLGVCRCPGHKHDDGMTEPSGIRYYDLRQVSGQSTHIDVDKGVIESAGTIFFNKAVIRVLGPRGWGILEFDNYSHEPGKKFNDLLASAQKLALVADDTVNLGDGSRIVRLVPPVKEDCRDVGIEEKAELLLAIEKAADLPLVTSRRANYSERIEKVRFMDSSGNEYCYEICRSGFSVMAVASRNGTVQMGYEPDHTIRGFNLRHREEMGRKAAATAVALLDAGAAKGGKMHAILDPELAGVFAHEAVGHASEGDLIEEGNSILKGRTGEKIGDDRLTIVDDPSLHEFGFEPVDAEGIAAGR